MFLANKVTTAFTCLGNLSREGRRLTSTFEMTFTVASFVSKCFLTESALLLLPENMPYNVLYNILKLK